MLERKKIAIFSLGFCLTAVLVITFTIKNTNKSIVGTFCSGNELSEEAVYITLYPDNTYLLYHQFDIISEGEYENDNVGDVEILYFDKKDDIVLFAIYDYQDSLFLLDSTSNSRKIGFKRISDIPLEINVSR